MFQLFLFIILVFLSCFLVFSSIFIISLHFSLSFFQFCCFCSFLHNLSLFEDRRPSPTPMYTSIAVLNMFYCKCICNRTTIFHVVYVNIADMTIANMTTANMTIVNRTIVNMTVSLLNHNSIIKKTDKKLQLYIKKLCKKNEPKNSTSIYQ